MSSAFGPFSFPNPGQPVLHRRLNATLAALIMNRAFKIMLVLGIVLTLVGMGVGFTAMFIAPESELAVYFIGIVPVGFLLTFAALTGWILAGGK